MSSSAAPSQAGGAVEVQDKEKKQLSGIYPERTVPQDKLANAACSDFPNKEGTLHLTASINHHEL
jgi:hypothetical protein